MAGSRERQRQRARERHERQREERRQRQSQLRKRLSIGAVVVLVLGLVAGLSLVFVGGSTPAAKSKPKATASASATSSAAAVAEPAHHCTYTNNGSGKPSLPTASPDYNASYTATINTNLGKIGISLLNSKATCTVNSFAHLAETNFFNNTQCWRVSNSSGLYLLQCGDPTATAKSKLSCSSSTLGIRRARVPIRRRKPDRGDISRGDRRHGQWWREHKRQPVLPCVQEHNPAR